MTKEKADNILVHHHKVQRMVKLIKAVNGTFEITDEQKEQFNKAMTSEFGEEWKELIKEAKNIIYNA